MLRRIALTLAAATAVGFMAAGTAAAAPMDHHHDIGGWAAGGFSSTGGHASFEHINLGGPWGITKTEGEIAGHHNTGGFALGGFAH